MTERHLREPPIVEVVCGLLFDPVPGLDPVAVGLFWNQRRGDFPAKQLHPAIGQGPAVVFGVGPVRTWLVSSSGERILQVQSDRFYFNWRQQAASRYPHFNTYDEPGVLDQCLEEFGRFAEFCARELGRRPEPKRVELAKIDLLVEGKHWQDFDDLSRVVPMLAGFRGLFRHPAVQLQAFEVIDGREVHVQVNGAVVTPQMMRGVQIETRIGVQSSGDPAATFRELNERANATFRQIIPESEWHRFGGLR